MNKVLSGCVFGLVMVTSFAIGVVTVTREHSAYQQGYDLGYKKGRTAATTVTVGGSSGFYGAGGGSGR